MIRQIAVAIWEEQACSPEIAVAIWQIAIVIRQIAVAIWQIAIMIRQIQVAIWRIQVAICQIQDAVLRKTSVFPAEPSASPKISETVNSRLMPTCIVSYLGFASKVLADLNGDA